MSENNGGGIPAGTCGDWNAWHDHMPPGPPRLFVTGRCTVPTTGFTVTLQRAVPQGFNPSILLLTKTVTPPDPGEETLPVETTLDVRYEEETAAELKQVTILPDVITVEVLEVR